MNVHKGHRDRLRERFIKSGLHSFEDHTALELLLFYAVPQKDTNVLAHTLLEHFGSFAAVMDASLDELCQIKGVGKTSAVLIKLVPEMCAYYLEDRAKPGTILDSTEKAGNFFLPKFFGKTVEEVYIVSLDDKRKIIRHIRLSEDGIVNAVKISVKRIVTEAVKSNATGIIIAHNHPSGIALPSFSDKHLTHQIQQALRMINVQLVDHIIIADNDFVSMADSGYLDIITPTSNE